MVILETLKIAEQVIYKSVGKTFRYFKTAQRFCVVPSVTYMLTVWVNIYIHIVTQFSSFEFYFSIITNV